MPQAECDSEEADAENHRNECLVVDVERLVLHVRKERGGLLVELK